ncbi:MAG TPA: hypothetical protein PKZ35_09330 [Gammaproteobacteria bacterium]|nr:hypothetical protein [Gammaproteobacteria bacterium]
MAEPIGGGTAITVGIEYFEVNAKRLGDLPAEAVRLYQLCRRTFIHYPDIQVAFKHVLDNLATARAASNTAAIEHRHGTLGLH